MWLLLYEFQYMIGIIGFILILYKYMLIGFNCYTGAVVGYLRECYIDKSNYYQGIYNSFHGMRENINIIIFFILISIIVTIIIQKIKRKNL